MIGLPGCDRVFTDEEVAALWRWQFGPWGDPFDPHATLRPRMHPFTCPNRGDGKHLEVGGDLGILVPTRRGWICLCCDYRQLWAHDFMMRAGR